MLAAYDEWSSIFYFPAQIKLFKHNIENCEESAGLQKKGLCNVRCIFHKFLNIAEQQFMCSTFRTIIWFKVFYRC